MAVSKTQSISAVSLANIHAGVSRQFDAESIDSPSTIEAEDDAVQVSVSTESRTNVARSAVVRERVKILDSAATDPDAVLVAISDNNESTLAEQSPALAQQYVGLVDKIGTDSSRLKDFVKGVADVIETSKNESTDEASSTIAIGAAISPTARGQLDAVYAASVNGPVAVIPVKKDISVDLQLTAQNSLDGDKLNQLDFAENGGPVGASGESPTSALPFSSPNDLKLKGLLPKSGLGLEKGTFPELRLFDQNKDGHFDLQDILREGGFESQEQPASKKPNTRAYQNDSSKNGPSFGTQTRPVSFDA